MESLEITTHSARETQKIGRLFAREILHSHIEHYGALVVALEGDLGGGKTTFAQGFARGLGVREKVASPTFIIMRQHNLRKSDFRIFVHIDAYRVEKVHELHVLGWQDILKDAGAIVLVEWANRIRRILPKEYMRIQFEFVDEKIRNIKLSQNSNVKIQNQN